MSLKERPSASLGIAKCPDTLFSSPLGAGGGHTSQAGKLVAPPWTSEPPASDTKGWFRIH